MNLKYTYFIGGDSVSRKRKDYDYAVKMYNDGLSIGNIASFYGITRQAMYMILKRRKVNFRPNLRYGKDNHFFRGGKVRKGNANDIVEQALIKGSLIKPDACEQCGGKGSFTDGRSAIQSHHNDYNKPLDVIWLCQKCHHEWHKTNTPIGMEK